MIYINSVTFMLTPSHSCPHCDNYSFTCTFFNYVTYMSPLWQLCQQLSVMPTLVKSVFVVCDGVLTHQHICHLLRMYSSSSFYTCLTRIGRELCKTHGTLFLIQLFWLNQYIFLHTKNHWTGILGGFPVTLIRGEGVCESDSYLQDKLQQ